MKKPRLDLQAELTRRAAALGSDAAHPARVCLRADASSSSADLYLYDSIGGFFGIPASVIVAALDEVKGRDLRVHINSPGGDVFDGLAIYNALRAYAGGVETIVEGLAGSIAGVIALAGERMTMAKASFYMIHDPHGIAIGGAARMRHLAALLDKTGVLLAEVYAEKASAPIETVREWMSAETWYTAEEALAAGFADAVIEEAEAAPLEARHARDVLAQFQHVPAGLETPLAPTRAAPAPRPSPRARDRAAALVQSFGYLVGT
jgi:ATP-dependent Clp endopeptidase proteolytic subunit ClpP